MPTANQQMATKLIAKVTGPFSHGTSPRSFPNSSVASKVLAIWGLVWGSPGSLGLELPDFVWHPYEGKRKKERERERVSPKSSSVTGDARICQAGP